MHTFLFLKVNLMARQRWGRSLGRYDTERAKMLMEQESEMLGIMFGDGSMSKVGGSIQITITGSKVEDKEYLIEHVRPLFAKVFGIELKTRYRPNENTMDLYAYSKKVAFRFHTWGMPIGLKNAVKLRPKVELNEKGFVRGLFDTDGCVYRKYGRYKQIQFKSSSAILMEYVRESIEKLDFHPTNIQRDETRYKFYLCRQKEVNLFFETIAPANKKHLRRFREIHESLPLSA